MPHFVIVLLRILELKTISYIGIFDVNPITNSPVDMMFDLYISQLKSEGIIEDK